MNNYVSDQLIRFTNAITTTADNMPAIPSALGFKIQLPDGTTVDLTSSVVNDGGGEYHADYVPTLVGIYTYQWRATGTIRDAAINQFRVIQATF